MNVFLKELGDYKQIISQIKEPTSKTPEEKAADFMKVYENVLEKNPKLADISFYSTWRLKFFSNDKGKLAKNSKSYLIEHPERLDTNIQYLEQFLDEEITLIKRVIPVAEIAYKNGFMNIDPNTVDTTNYVNMFQTIGKPQTADKIKDFLSVAANVATVAALLEKPLQEVPDLISQLIDLIRDHFLK